MKVKVRIAVVAGRDANGDPEYCASGTSECTEASSLDDVETWAAECSITPTQRFMVTAFIDLPEVPATQEVEGEAEEVER